MDEVYPSLNRSHSTLKERLSEWSLRAIPINLLDEYGKIMTATAFIWRTKDKDFLITNWHVLAGRNPINGRPIDKDCRIPILLEYPRFLDADDSNKRVWNTVSLYEDKDYANWIQHKEFGRRVDIAAIQVDRCIRHADNQISHCNPINVFGLDAANRSTTLLSFPFKHRDVGSEVFILGYPLDLQVSGYFPIWKRASVANELDINVRDLPCFLVDTASRPGMSGSPVVFTDSDKDVSNYLMGVYSGRLLGDEKDDAQLGVVWKIEALRQIVDGGETKFDKPEIYSWS